LKYYLSSYRVGNHGEKFAEMLNGRRVAYIPNALDHISIEDQTKTRDRNQKDLENLSINSEILDLKDYFDNSEKLSEVLSNYAGVWVTGGNTFVLRQAMKLSGFDSILKSVSEDFIYAGYSAGVCVLAPNLEPLQIVDDPNKSPYPQLSEPIWDGLNILNHMILPHYKSDHPESADIDLEVAECEKKGIPYKTIRDGEVFYGENILALNKNISIKP